MSLSPASVAIICNSSDNTILLVKRCDVPFWVLPGGGIDENETPEQAVIREVFEETGFHIIVDKKCALYSPINQLSAITHLFQCKIVAGNCCTSKETCEIKFFSLNHLPSQFFFIHEKWLKENLYSSHLIQRPLYEITYGALFNYFIKHPWFVIRFAWTRIFK